MKKYKVYFEQINYQCFTVEANGRESAAKKAIRDWKECNRDPSVSFVEEVTNHPAPMAR